MFAEALNNLSGSDVIVIAAVLLIVAAITVWRLYYVEQMPRIDSTLSDGTVLLLSDGLIRQVSPGAEALLGDCTDVPIDQVLTRFIGQEETDAHTAIRQVEATGEPLNLLIPAADDTLYELIAAPAGAMIRIVLRESALMQSKIAEAEERVQVVEGALQNQDWARTTMEALVADAPIIVWHRTDDGTVNWSAGEIRAPGGAVSADQAVDLIVARTRLNRQPIIAGTPQKSRIEIVLNDGAETVSLHVIEIVKPDGERVGLATDAGTAASAERTLTRFVQTMTETFAHLTVGLAIFDRNQTLALFNPALVQMWQAEPAWLARRPSLRDIIDELRATRRLPELQDFHNWRSRLISLFENTEAADYEELWHLADGSNIRVLARPHPHGSRRSTRRHVEGAQSAAPGVVAASQHAVLAVATRVVEQGLPALAQPARRVVGHRDAVVRHGQELGMGPTALVLPAHAASSSTTASSPSATSARRAASSSSATSRSPDPTTVSARARFSSSRRSMRSSRVPWHTNLWTCTLRC